MPGMNRHRVRFKSRGRGLSSIENKRNDTGLRFVLQKPEEGNQGFLIWKDDQLAALIDWEDPVVKHGLAQPIKYARLLQRKASSLQAKGADARGFRYAVQLVLEGVPHHKPKHPVGSDIIGADLGPSTIALFPREGEASLSVFCEELAPNEQAIRRLQRKMDRPFWLPISIQQIPIPHVPGIWRTGKVRRRALRAAHERVIQRANEGQFLPRSMGLARAGARRPESPNEATQGPAFLLAGGQLEAWKHRSELPRL
jgi:hypothetical protein